MSSPWLLVRSGERLCALRARDVVEIMRPLPVEAAAGAPAFVRGTSIVRGEPVPAVDLRTLLGDDDSTAATRMVIVRVGDGRLVALWVDAVLGLRDVGERAGGDIPPLLGDEANQRIDELARLDDELLTVLRAGALLPAELHQQLLEDRES